MSSRPGSGSESGDRCTDLSTASPPEAMTKPDTTRKRAWATRSRGGCRTCRARRVRCDEERPKCRRCVRGGHQCRGYELPPPDKKGVIVFSATEPEPVKEQHTPEPKPWRASAHQPDRLVADIDPPYWDYMQAVRFYSTCVRAWRPKEFGVVEAPTLSDETHPANFVGRQLALYIKMLSLHRGKLLLPPPAHERGLSALWASYARTMLEMIELINYFIAGGTFNGRNYIYSCIFTLMRLDLPAHWSLWHKHIRGSIAYVRSVGGVAAMLAAGTRFGPPIGFTRMLSEAIMFSTTTPAHMQIADYNGFTDREMRLILQGEHDCDLPAPLDLRIAIFHINRLRYEAATQPAPTDLTPMVHEILDEIEGADVDQWSSENPVYGINHSLALSRIFHIAVRLFALLTLPRPATSLWVRAAAAQHARGAPGLDPYHVLRVALRTELLVRMRALFPRLQYQPSLRWPMVVAGVAAADGTMADREFVSRSLRIIWEQPVVTCGPMRCREVLHDFWKSGKTEWEDCFVEPVPC